jgi:hypothetical protein
VPLTTAWFFFGLQSAHQMQGLQRFASDSNSVQTYASNSANFWVK